MIESRENEQICQQVEKMNKILYIFIPGDQWTQIMAKCPRHEN